MINCFSTVRQQVPVKPTCPGVNAVKTPDTLRALTCLGSDSI